LCISQLTTPTSIDLDNIGVISQPEEDWEQVMGDDMLFAGINEYVSLHGFWIEADWGEEDLSLCIGMRRFSESIGHPMTYADELV
jgi:hypothetical protein